LREEPTVYMVQIMPTLWRIESKDGRILTDDIRLYSLRDAEKDINNWISTWYAWKYEIKPLRNEK
jgi:hypothetical protein